MVKSFEMGANVDKVSGSVGPLYYGIVDVEGVAVRAFDKFREIGRKAGISGNSLKCPDLVLRDYNQQPIPVGAKVELTFKWKNKEITTPAYIRSERSKGNLVYLGPMLSFLLV